MREWFRGLGLLFLTAWWGDVPADFENDIKSEVKWVLHTQWSVVVIGGGRIEILLCRRREVKMQGKICQHLMLSAIAMANGEIEVGT